MWTPSSIRSLVRCVKTIATQPRQISPLLKATRPPKAWAESVMKPGREMKARPSDVFIVGYPKTGVHVTAQMAHIVRACGQGTADISYLSQVTPFIYMLDSHDIPYDANQSHDPRIFLSHDIKDHLPSGGKYIYILRDPIDVFNAFVPFMRSLMKFQLAESVLFCIWVFATRYSAIPGTDYFTHVSKWWEHRDDPNVLFVSYDDVVYCKPQAEKKLAQFMGIEIDDKQLQDEVRQVSEIQSSHNYMVENDDKFNSLVISRVWNQKFGFPPHDDEVQIIRPDGGVSGQGKQRLPEHVINDIEGLWEEILAPKTGCPSFQDFQAQFRLV